MRVEEKLAQGGVVYLFAHDESRVIVVHPNRVVPYESLNPNQGIPAPGIGPDVVVVSNPTTKATYFGGEAALDFMFWPWGRRVGQWVEPEYDLVFQQGASSGIGATGGVLVGW